MKDVYVISILAVGIIFIITTMVLILCRKKKVAKRQANASNGTPNGPSMTECYVQEEHAKGSPYLNGHSVAYPDVPHYYVSAGPFAITPPTSGKLWATTTKATATTNNVTSHCSSTVFSNADLMKSSPGSQEVPEYNSSKRPISFNEPHTSISNSPSGSFAVSKQNADTIRIEAPPHFYVSSGPISFKEPYLMASPNSPSPVGLPSSH